MANATHVAMLTKGAKVWNNWRRSNGDDSQPDLNGAALIDIDLAGFDLHEAEMANSILQEVSLVDANLRGASFARAMIENCDFTGSDLTDARFTTAEILYSKFHRARMPFAVLMWAHVIGSNFSNSVLESAVLTYAVFNRTDLRQSSVRHADATLSSFIDSNLESADFSASRFGWTTFASVTLASAVGLEHAQHVGPSMLAIQVLMGDSKLPAPFLRGIGLPDSAVRQTFELRPDRYHSCFISYSSIDQAFADALYKDLQDHGVRCWLATEDLKIGEQFRSKIEESILSHDKLLLILSRDSVKSPWVRGEVETAFEREHRSATSVLFPIRLDNSIMESGEAWASEIRRTRHMGDFQSWQDRVTYRKSLKRLLRDLSAQRLPPPPDLRHPESQNVVPPR